MKCPNMPKWLLFIVLATSILSLFMSCDSANSVQTTQALHQVETSEPKKLVSSTTSLPKPYATPMPTIATSSEKSISRDPPNAEIVMDLEFQSCVAEKINPEIAQKVFFDGEGIFFAEGFDSNKLSQTQMNLIFYCAFPSEEDAIKSDEMIEPVVEFTVDLEFQSCVAEKINPEIAQKVFFNGEGIIFAEGFDSNKLPQTQMDLIFHCAFPPEEDVIKSDEMIEPVDLEFQSCVAEKINPEIATNVFRSPDSSIMFLSGFDFPQLTKEQMESILLCADPEKGPLTSDDRLFQECVATKGDITQPDDWFYSFLRLTKTGLPDFSHAGSAVVLPQYFHSIMECVPGFEDNLPLTEITPEIMIQAKSVAEQTRNSVVLIETSGGTGTGFFISKSGLIMTNYHVVADDVSVTVWLIDGRKFEGRVLGGILNPDVALIQIDGEGGFVPLSIGESTSLEMGQKLISVGHPGDVGNWVTTIGDFISTSFMMSDDDKYHINLNTSVPGKQGVSGAPLMDLEGNVVGLVYSGSSRDGEHTEGSKSFIFSDQIFDYVVSMSLGNAISIEDAMTIVSDITKDTSIIRTIRDKSEVSNERSVMTAEIGSCLSSAIGEERESRFDLTLSGLPDFSDMGMLEISSPEFMALVECIPTLYLFRSPIKMANTMTQQKSFSDQILNRAYLLSQNVRNSVVVVETPEGNGTGWLLSENGEIITNEHVVEGLDEVTIRLLDGRRFPGTVVGRINPPDVAVVKIVPPSGMVPLSLGDSSKLQKGDPLVVVGHPGIMGNWVTTIGPFEEISIIKDAQGNNVQDLVSLVPSVKGNSGSPLFNIDGKVIGLIYGGKPLVDRLLSDPPTVDSLEIKEILIPKSFSLAATIEDVLKVSNEWID